MSRVDIVGANGAELEDDFEPATEELGAAPGSLLAKLREQAQRGARHYTTTLVIPTWEGLLGARYHPLPIHELERYADLTGRITNLNLAFDMLAGCCEALVARPNDPEEEDLADEQGVVGYGPRAAQLLGLGVEHDPTPAGVITAIFRDNGIAINDHATALFEWMGDPSREPPGGASAPTG